MLCLRLVFVCNSDYFFRFFYNKQLVYFSWLLFCFCYIQFLFDQIHSPLSLSLSLSLSS